MKKVMLVIVFNHRYDDNIKKLKTIYKSRFSNIKFIVPFYDGEPSVDIIPVYENSFQFEGYFAQAFSRYYDESISHYIFCSDDVIINPSINEANILSELNLRDDTSFIPAFSSLSKTYSWIPIDRLIDCENSFCQKGANYQSEIISRDQAIKRAARYDIRCSKIPTYNGKITLKSLGHFILGIKNSLGLGNVVRQFKPFKYLRYIRQNNGDQYYPLAYGDSDLFIISGKNINEFSRLSGIFAAMGLFAESAVPTAMIYTCDCINTNKEVPKWRHVNGNDGVSFNFADYDYDMEKLNSNWEPDVFRYHPVKLSKWKI